MEFADLPEDVQQVLTDTYSPVGIGIWLLNYDRVDDERREHLLQHARTMSEGT